MAMNLRIFMPGNPSEGHKRIDQTLLRELPADSAAQLDAHDPVLDEMQVNSFGPVAAFLVRVFDLCASLAMLLFLAIPMLIISAIVKLDSPGPVLFKQIRVGKDGREFWFYKFRSMVADAEARRAALLQMNEASGPLF